MAHVDIGIGSFSFYAVNKEDRTDFSVNTLVRMNLLPETISPFEKQLRVAVNGVEYTHDDGSDPTLITAKWQYETTPKPNQGLLVSDIRVTFDSGGVVQVAEFGVRDGNGDWYTDLVFGTNVFVGGGAGNEARLFDLDGTANYVDAGTVVLFISFDKPRVVSAFGWSRDVSGSGATITDMEVSVNVGGFAMLRTDPVYRSAGSQTGIVVGDYTNPSNFDPDDDLLFIEVDASLGEDDDIVNNPVVTVTPPLTLAGDQLVIWRETRQDRPHNPPRKGARADGENLHWFFTQRLFIMQDLCDYQQLGPFLDFVPYTQEIRDFSIGSQRVQFTGTGGGQDTFSMVSLEFLTGIPGTGNLGNQIVVETGNKTDGSSTFWSVENAATYTVNSVTKEVVLDATTTRDVRIRRTTKIDGLWFDLRDKTLSWNSLIIILLMQQIRFLVEEACFVPALFSNSILNNTIFPREWNWLVYTGTDLFHIFGGPFWTGDGEITVWDNDILLTTPTDYTTEYPQIKFTGPITQPHIGATGNYWADGAEGLPGDASNTPGSQPIPPEDQAPVDPLDPIFNAGINIAISISFIDPTTCRNGPVEGFPGGIVDVTSGTNTSSFRNNMVLQLFLTINQVFAGETQVGKKVVAYVGGVCNGSVVFGLKAIAKASDNNGDGIYESTVEASGALGCLDSNGGITNVASVWANWLAFRGVYGPRELITANERAMIQIMDADIHRDGARLRQTSAILGMDVVVDQGIANGGTGTTSPGDINGIMGP